MTDRTELLSRSIRLRGEVSSTRMARQIVAEAASMVGLTTVAADAEACVSELVANAILHTNSDVVDLMVSADGQAMRIEVHDDSPARPALRVPEPEAESGRGMLIVDALAAEWGVDVFDGEGKAVWARLEPV